jgi:hypothetical protein
LYFLLLIGSLPSYRSVDGQNLNYWKYVDTTQLQEESFSTTFVGYITKNDVRAFVFQKLVLFPMGLDPIPDPPPETAPLSRPHPRHGTIRVSIHEVEKENIESNSPPIFTQIELPEEYRVDPQDKAISSEQLPSVTTVGGRIVRTKKDVNERISWKYKTSPNPLTTMTLFYHSMEMIQSLEADQRSISFPKPLVSLP